MQRRVLPIQDRGLVLLMGIAVLATGMLVFREMKPAGVTTPPSPIQLQGVQILLPRFEESAPLNINRASSEDLATLPGIGPALAQRIVDYRAEHGQFNSVEELEFVSGIGPVTIRAIQEEGVVVRDEP